VRDLSLYTAEPGSTFEERLQLLAGAGGLFAPARADAYMCPVL
jgi:hypothetical protein